MRLSGTLVPTRALAPAVVPLALALVGCANDPMYIPAPMVMEAGVPDAMGMLSAAKASLALPIKLETTEDAAKRAELAMTLAPITVPYVRVGDLEIEVEWTLKNLEAKPGKARIQLNGANEYFAYDPSVLVLDPEDEEAPPPPGLAGDIPINVPPSGEISGVFTEDDLREAAIDLDQITRGNVNPFRANLTISKNAREFQPMTPPMPAVEDYVPTPVGPPVPRAAFAGLTQLDLVFTPDTHMTMEFSVRIRDLRGIMHPLLLAAVTAKPTELQTFMPMVYNPVPPAPVP